MPLPDDVADTLWTACRTGQTAVVDTMLTFHRKNDIIEWRMRTGAGFLSVASQMGHTGVVQSLLRAGAPVNDRFLAHRRTPLMFAADRGHVDTIRVLLDAGADPLLCERDGQYSVLSSAVAARSIDAVRMLLDAGATVNPSKPQWTPLHFAVECDAEMVELLFEHGANPDALCEGGFSPLDRACQLGNAWAVELLCEHGASMAHPRACGLPLAYACASAGSVDALRAVHARGADLNASCTCEWNKRETPAHAACAGGPRAGTAVLAYLLDHGADFTAGNMTGWTPVHVACQAGFVAGLELMRRHGVDFAHGGMLSMCTHRAAVGRHRPVLVWLWERGLLRATTVHGVLRMVLRRAQPDISIGEFLVEHGARMGPLRGTALPAWVHAAEMRGALPYAAARASAALTLLTATE